jgi:competence protein ComEC
MPRPAWLAIGVATAALALGTLASVATLLLAAACLVGGLGLRAAGRPGTARWLIPFAIGLLLLQARAASDGIAPLPAPPPSGAGPWVGVVVSIGSLREGSRPAVVQLEMEPPMTVAATLPWYPSVVPGDRVELRGRIRPPPDDDYGAYLARIGAAGTLRAEAVQVLPVEDSLGAWLEGLRRGAAAGLDRAMPEPEAGLAAGVLIGLRDRVDRGLAEDFTTAGASHVVAISGWNIAIVASTLAALAGGLQRRRRAVLTALAIVAYVAFVGPTASVVRAGVMAGVALLARELGRPGTAAAALGWACTVLLLVDPAYVDDAGFRLSVLATAGILAWGSPLTARLSGANPGRPRRWVSEILGVSFAAQAATTPIVLLDFGRLSLVAPLVNLLVVPLVPPAMAAGALALVVGVAAGFGVPGVLATLVGLPAWALYAAMVAFVRIGAGLPLASLELAAPWDAIGAGVSLVLVLAVARYGEPGLELLRRAARSRRRAPAVRAKGRDHPRAGARATRVAAVCLAGSTIGLSLAVLYRPDGAVRLTVLDVGQGDALLLEGGRGGRMVIDGGPEPYGLIAALDERLPPWDRRIDVVVLTHPHEDHVAGLPILLQRYRVGRVYESGLPGTSPGWRAWSDLFEAGGPPRMRLATGDMLVLDRVRLRVLWPDPGAVPTSPREDGKDINNTSIVLLGDVEEQRFLLTGDLEEDVDPTLVGRGLPTVDVLKVAHHGSRTATTPELLDATRPRVALISTDADNDYGHSAPETLQRLAERDVRTYRTDHHGTTEVRLDGTDVRVRTARNGPATARDYHRLDATVLAAGNRGARLDRAPRVLLWRRRVRAGGRPGRVPERRGALPRGPARALAARGGAYGPRPPPGRDPGAPRDGLHVRRGQRRDRARGRRPRSQQRDEGAAPGGHRDHRPGQRAGGGGGDRIGGQGSAEQDRRGGDPSGRRRGPDAQGAARGRARGVDRRAGTGARDPARAGRRA